MSARKLALYGKGTGPLIPCFQRPSRLVVVGGGVEALIDGQPRSFESGTHHIGEVGTVCVSSSDRLGSCFVECD